MNGRTGPSRSGFTLIEVIVVVIVIGLLATVLVPRLTSTRKQRFELFTSQVSDLLMMYAQRDNLGRRPIGLRVDTSSTPPTMQVVVRQEDATNSQDWTRDVSIRPVKLPEFVRADDIVLFADGEVVNIINWTLGHVPGENRPAIEVTIRDDQNQYESTLTLSSYGISPQRRGEYRAAARAQQVDLDAEGRSQEEW